MKNSPFMVKIKERHVEAVAIGNSITNLQSFSRYLKPFLHNLSLFWYRYN